MLLKKAFIFILFVFLLVGCTNSENQKVSAVLESTFKAVTAQNKVLPQDTEHKPELVGLTPINQIIVHNYDNSDQVYLSPNEGWKAIHVGQGMFHVEVDLLKTMDGGKTWTSITTSKRNASIPHQGYNGFTFIDSKTGWIVTDTPHMGFIGLYKTEDGGLTWKLQNLKVPKKHVTDQISCFPPVFFSDADAVLPLNIHCTDSNNAIYTIYITHDRGNTWTLNTDGISDKDFIWSFKDSGGCVVWTAEYKGQTWKSFNGLTWEQQ